MSSAFISHATADRRIVERELCGLLRALGLDVWFAEEDIQTSQQWERAILSGLQDSKWFILAMSPRAAESEWVRDETHWAIEERPDFIIPVLFEDCDPKQFHIRLPRIQYLDFRKDKRESRERLVSLIVEKEYLNSHHAKSQLYHGIKAVIQASDLPMFFIDNDWKVQFCNRQLTTLLGFHWDELDQQPVQVLVDRFVSLAPEETRDDLRAKQDWLQEAGIPDHSEEDHVIDLRHMIGSRYRGLKRVWISADRVYDPESEALIGVFVVYHVMDEKA